MKKHYLFFIYFLIGGILSAQVGGSEWKHFNASNSGIKNNNIKIITVSNGSAWVGCTTIDGALSEYDGSKWTVYNTMNSPITGSRINGVVSDGYGIKWVASDWGLLKFATEGWNIFNSDNSELPSNTITCITLDNKGDKWMGTKTCLIKLSGTTWSIFNTSNSKLPDNTITCVAVDKQDNVWIGTNKGLAQFNASLNKWTVFSQKNSSLPDDAVSSIAVDSKDNIWIGTSQKGVAKYDRKNWFTYSKSKDALPDNKVTSVAADKEGIIWVGTQSNMASFDGTKWTLFSTSNSEIPSEFINTITIDENNNKWIGTNKGVVVYKKGGVDLSNLGRVATVAHADKEEPNPTPQDMMQYRGSGDMLKGLNVSKAKDMLIGNYYALIIGIDNYKGFWSPLKNAVNDARTVEEVLKLKYKFDYFKSLYNEKATRDNIIKEMEWLVANVRPQDNVLIYYSGHGEFKQTLNKGYWVPIDATTESISAYISNSDIQTFLGGIKSKHTLLVSDACFSGDIFRGKTITVPFEESERYFKEVHGLISRQAITSGGIEPVMDGGMDGHSVFAYYFLKALKENTNKYYDAGQLYNSIKIPVYNNSEQSPKLSAINKTGDEGGQFIFIKK